MDLKINERNGSRAAVVGDPGFPVNTPQDALDLIMQVKHDASCDKMVLFKEALTEDFFRLETRVAGEMLQKFVTYHMKLAVVGDFSGYDSKSLRDFIRESNRGSSVFFLPTEEEALERLHKAL